MIKNRTWITYLTNEVVNGSIYLWGGQGEDITDLSDDYIARKETSKANAERVKKLRDARIRAKLFKAKAFDCSGLGVYILLKFGEIKKDTTAHGLMLACTKISRSELQPGDFVFRVDKNNHAYHVGYVVAENKVIHAKGRDEGVVEETLNHNGSTWWNAYGRSKFIEPEEESYENYVFTENLYEKKCKGKTMEAVKALQWLLNRNGFNAGSIDGQWGKNTQKAVGQAQKSHKLKVDYQAGKNTIKALGGLWK